MIKKLLILLSLSCTTVFAGTNYMKNGRYYMYVNNDNNVIECTAGQLCDIALLPGDIPMNWIISDGIVWNDSTANTPKYRDNDGVIHAIIQSTDLQAGTTAILGGKNNSYTFTLKSVKKSLTNKYVFIEDLQSKFKKDAIIEESINFSAIPRKDTKYYMKGDTDSSITPVAVFNDGKKTYIQLRNDINTEEMPSVKSFSPQGRLEEAAGCRVKYPYFVCDSLYPRLAIVLGSAENPDEYALRVNIYRGEKPSGFKWLMQQYAD